MTINQICNDINKMLLLNLSTEETQRELIYYKNLLCSTIDTMVTNNIPKKQNHLEGNEYT